MVNPTRTAGLLTALLLAFVSNATIADQPGPLNAPTDTSSWIGTNYTPAYASNQVQMWHDFRPEVIERELAAARRYYGINTLRVYLHNMVYDAEKEIFLKRIEEFLVICQRHAIRPGFTFFD